METRNYITDDKAQLIECIAGLQQHEHALDENKLPGAEVARVYFEYVMAECKRQDGIVTVAIDSTGMVAGFSIYWIENDDDPTIRDQKFAYLSDIYVKPEYQGQGIGHKLICEWKSYAEKNKARKGTPFQMVFLRSH